MIPVFTGKSTNCQNKIKGDFRVPIPLNLTFQIADPFLTCLTQTFEHYSARSLLDVSHQHRLEEARQSFNAQLELWQIQEVNENVFPLRTPYGFSALFPGENQENQRVKVNVFFARVSNQVDFGVYQETVERYLVNFLQRYYDFDQSRIENRISDWKEGFNEPVNIRSLYDLLRGYPSIVVTPIQPINNSELSLQSDCWLLGPSDAGAITEEFFRIDMRREVKRIIREKMIELKKSGTLSGSEDFDRNLDILEEEETIHNGGGDNVGVRIDQLLLGYQMCVECETHVVKSFSLEIASYAACQIGLFLDLFYLAEYGEAPRLPQALNQFLEDNKLDYKIPSSLLEEYQRTLSNLAQTNYLSHVIPNYSEEQRSLLYLGVADAFRFLSIDAAKEIAFEGVNKWAEKRGLVEEPTVSLRRRRRHEPEETVDQKLERGAKSLRRGATVWTKGFVSKAVEILQNLNVPIDDVRYDAGEEKKINVDGYTYVFRLCPAGTFLMGSPTGEAYRLNDEVQHEVTLSRDFWMLETPVTQRLWFAVRGRRPSRFRGDDRPVENVSWDECQTFIRELNEKLNNTDTDFAHSGLKVRLPTEAEWEYACRAGTTGPYAGDLDKMAWYDPAAGLPVGGRSAASQSGTHDVRQLDPNAWGLYDMHGNVWEWCSDWYGAYPQGPVTDPMGPPNGADRVFRGGCWYDSAGRCRSANRHRYDRLTLRYDNLGLRLALSSIR